MTISKNILRRSIDLDLTDNEIQELEHDSKFIEDIDNIKKSNYLSEELLLPGYNQLVENKSNELSDLLDKSTRSSSNIVDLNRYQLMIKLIGIAAIFLVVISYSGLFSSNSLNRAEINQELKMLAINSFDNSGLLHATRSTDIDQAKKLMYESYQSNVLITKDNCALDPELCQLTNAVIKVKAGNYEESITILNNIEGYEEIKNKLLLYSYYQMEDKKYLENVSIINKNKFPNYNKINDLLN